MSDILYNALAGGVSAGIAYLTAFALRRPIARLWRHPLWQKHGTLVVTIVLAVALMAIIGGVVNRGGN